jgi:hypothetical protein
VLLAKAGKTLNEIVYTEMASQLATFPQYNPWHVCYAVAMGWGHLAQLEQAFTESAPD